MRAALTSLVALAAISFPASSQVVTGTIRREPISSLSLSRLSLLSSPSPSTARRGQQNVTIQFTGVNTHFSQGVTTVSMGPGITIVSPVTVALPTSASAVISIDAAASAGTRPVTITSGGETVTLNEGFAVLENPDPFAKACGAATALGSLFPGMSRQVVGWLDMAGVQDWFAVSVPAGVSLKLSLSGVGAGSEFEIATFSSCATQGASTSAGVTPKEIIIPAGQAQNVFVRLSASQWAAASPRFTLTLTGN